MYDATKLSVCERVISLKEIQDTLDTYASQGSPISPLAYLLVEIWKIVGSTEKRPFHETPIFFKEIHVYSEIDLLTEDLSHVYLSVLRGSGDFIVNQVMKTDGNAVESDKTLLRGRCKVSEEPSFAPSLKTIVEDFQSEKETDPVFSDVDSDNPVASKLSEIQVCSKGVFGKIEWTRDWAINLNTIIDLHLYLNTDKAGRLIEVASMQSVHLIPESLQSKTDGSKIEFYIDSSTARFDCEGVIVDGLSTRPARSKDSNLAVILDFVPYGETSFSTEYEFIKACLEVILENSSQENTADKKITIFKRRNDLMANQVCSWLKDAVNSFNSKKQELFQVKVEESYFADEIESSDLLVSMVLADDKNDAYSMIIQPYQSRRVSEKEHSVVYEQNFGTDRFLFLKKVNGVSKLRTFKLDKDWRLSIEKLKTNAQPGETVLLVIDDPSLANPLFSAREVSRELIAYKTRCYIILDGKAPSFSPHSQICGSQIQRDVAVNVLVNGRWGRYRRQEIPRAVLTRMSHTTVETVDGDEEVDIKYLSFNETNHGGKEDGVTLLDYSGVTRSGHRVMGLARKKDGVGEKAVPDPILRWKLPPQIPLDVAATFPYAYLMGNLAIRDLQTFHEYKKQVMVHNGQTPVGTACISLALTNGHTVYCTVPNGAAKELIMENFPQIPASRITNHMDRDFFVPLMLETKGHGADLIISDLPEEQMHNSWNCIATHGVFVNLNGALAAHNSPLPMSNFLKMTSFLSYTPRDIANFSPERKRRLSGLVEEWLLAEHPVKIPYRIFAPDEINCSVKASCLQPEEKLLLNLQDCKRNIVKGIIENGKASEIDDILPHTNPEIYFILCSTLEDSMTLMKSLAQRNIKQFAIASLDSPPHEDALKALQICAKEHDVSVSVMSGVNSLSRKDAKALMRRVSKIGMIKAAFVVSSVSQMLSSSEQKHLRE
ncbi:uncharacterized protein [Bemisia tabaci]|uniref:uncharacterized protein n=1 Tax=Bemisia tabaci TaxID=7038 RepID=UPI003B2803DF